MKFKWTENKIESKPVGIDNILIQMIVDQPLRCRSNICSNCSISYTFPLNWKTSIVQPLLNSNKR